MHAPVEIVPQKQMQHSRSRTTTTHDTSFEREQEKYDPT